MDKINQMEFWEWITDKYVQWRGDAVGHDRSITDYASWIGVSQSLMTQWMKRNGKNPKSQKSITKLADKYPEIYDLFKFEKPRPRYDVSRLPSSTRRDLEGALDEIDVELSRRNITGDMPEAETITLQIFEKWGFKYTVTNKPD